MDKLFRVYVNIDHVMLEWKPEAGYAGTLVVAAVCSTSPQAVAVAQALRIFLDSWITIDGEPLGPAIKFFEAFDLKPALAIGNHHLTSGIMAAVRRLTLPHGTETAAKLIG